MCTKSMLGNEMCIIAWASRWCQYIFLMALAFMKYCYKCPGGGGGGEFFLGYVYNHGYIDGYMTEQSRVYRVKP